MPAVDLKRLDSQIDGLLWRYTRPEEFIQELRSIFNFYSDRVQRPGHLVSQNQIFHAYHLPPLVMRQLELRLKQKAQTEPAQTLALLDLLSQEEKWEPRLLAAYLLGVLPLTCYEDINARLMDWSSRSTDKKILKPLLDKGAARLAHEQPKTWLNTLNQWSNSSNKSDHRLLLLAIQNLLEDPDFDNLPPIFDMITRTMYLFPQALQESIFEVFEKLIPRSAAECAYLIRHIIRLGTSGSSPALLRKITTLFPDPIRRSLLDEMRTPLT